jgi:hypothetical protein
MLPRRPLLRHSRLDPPATLFVDTLNAHGPACHHDPHGVWIQARGNVACLTRQCIAVRRGLTATTGLAHNEHPPSWQLWVSNARQVVDPYRGRHMPAPCLTEESQKERFFAVLRGRRSRFVQIQPLCTQRTLSRQWISPDGTLPVGPPPSRGLCRDGGWAGLHSPCFMEAATNADLDASEGEATRSGGRNG